MQVKWEEDWFIQRYMGSCVCRPRSSALTLFKEETNEILYPIIAPNPQRLHPVQGKIKTKNLMATQRNKFHGIVPF